VWVADADCRCHTKQLCCVLQVSLDLQPVEGVHRVTRSCCGTMVRAVAPARCAQVWTGPACACATFFGPV
jgi:hypothetical protein